MFGNYLFKFQSIAFELKKENQNISTQKIHKKKTSMIQLYNFGKPNC